MMVAWVWRLYDKRDESLRRGNGHIKPIWKENGWDGEQPVSRLEFQLRRDGLRRFDRTMDFVTFQDCKSDIWAYATGKMLRIVEPRTATRRERAKPTDYWQDFQKCQGLFGERLGVLPHKQECLDWEPLVAQSDGCLASAYARIAANMGDEKAIVLLERKWGQRIPQRVIEAGLLQKARFAHMS